MGSDMYNEDLHFGDDDEEEDEREEKLLKEKSITKPSISSALSFTNSQKVLAARWNFFLAQKDKKLGFTVKVICEKMGISTAKWYSHKFLAIFARAASTEIYRSFVNPTTFPRISDFSKPENLPRLYRKIKKLWDNNQDLKVEARNILGVAYIEQFQAQMDAIDNEDTA